MLKTHPDPTGLVLVNMFFRNSSHLYIKKPTVHSCSPSYACVTVFTATARSDPKSGTQVTSQRLPPSVALRDVQGASYPTGRTAQANGLQAQYHHAHISCPPAARGLKPRGHPFSSEPHNPSPPAQPQHHLSASYRPVPSPGHARRSTQKWWF